jgi:hypothetical protein
MEHTEMANSASQIQYFNATFTAKTYRKKTQNPNSTFEFGFLYDDSDWARTSDLHPVKIERGKTSELNT